MARFYAAIALLIFTVGISFTCFFILKSKADNLTENLEEALALSEEGSDKLVEETAKIEEIWDGTSRIMHMLIIHTDLIDLEVNLLSLSEYAAEDDWDNYSEACIVSIHHIEHIKKSLIPDWGNIL